MAIFIATNVIGNKFESNKLEFIQIMRLSEAQIYHYINVHFWNTEYGTAKSKDIPAINARELAV